VKNNSLHNVSRCTCTPTNVRLCSTVEETVIKKNPKKSNRKYFELRTSLSGTEGIGLPNFFAKAFTVLFTNYNLQIGSYLQSKRVRRQIHRIFVSIHGVTSHKTVWYSCSPPLETQISYNYFPTFLPVSSWCPKA